MAEQQTSHFPALSLVNSGLVFQLTRAEVFVLFALYRECSKSGHRKWRRMTTEQLRAITGVSQPTVINALTGLERHRLIERQRDPTSPKRASKYRINWKTVTRLEERQRKSA